MSIIDVREVVGYTDILVICSARNRRQVQAIAAEARRVAKEHHGFLAKVEGMEVARWVLVDFGSVVLHVFDEQIRGFYDLQGLWRDAPRLAVPEVADRESGDLLSV